MTSLSELLYTVSYKAIKSTVPVNFLYGAVTQADPLKIRIAGDIELIRENLILTDNVRDMTYSVSKKQFQTDTGGANPSHTHPVVLPEEITIYRRLKLGEKVLLANFAGGSRYVVLSRAEDRTKIDSSEPYDAKQ